MKFAPLFIVVILCTFPTLVSAAGYKVTPYLIDKEVKPRDIFAETIKIENHLHHKVVLYPSVNEVSIDAGGDITAFTPPSMSDNTQTVTSWLAISRARLEILPGETVEIPLSVKIHPDAQPGVYHAFVGFGTGGNRPEAEKQVSDRSAPGVLVTMKVDQDQQEFMRLSKFIVDRFVTKPDNSAITYTLSNPGETPVVPKGEIILYNSRGEEVGSIPVNPDGETLAAGQESTHSVAAPTDGLMGKYKAFLSVDYGTEQLASLYDTAFFYIMPWQKLLIIFGVVLFVAIALTIWLHKRSQREYEVEEHAEVPVFVREGISVEADHDINLKRK